MLLSGRPRSSRIFYTDDTAIETKCNQKIRINLPKYYFLAFSININGLIIKINTWIIIIVIYV